MYQKCFYENSGDIEEEEEHKINSIPGTTEKEMVYVTRGGKKVWVPISRLREGEKPGNKTGKTEVNSWNHSQTHQEEEEQKYN